jgi:hypothetical protein
MTIDDARREPPRLDPVIEALLVYERTILPQVAIVRARAISRARATLRTTDNVRAIPARFPIRTRRLAFAVAAGFVLATSAAAAFQWLLGTASVQSADPLPSPGLHRAQATHPTVATSPASPAGRTPSANAADTTGTAQTQSAEAGQALNSSSANDDVLEELRLLERAQKLVMREDFTAVLTLTAEHERRYPKGRFCEEREALRLRALIGLGRGREARQAVAQFRTEYPRSVLLPKLDDLLPPPR